MWSCCYFSFITILLLYICSLSFCFLVFTIIYLVLYRRLSSFFTYVCGLVVVLLFLFLVYLVKNSVSFWSYFPRVWTRARVSSLPSSPELHLSASLLFPSHPFSFIRALPLSICLKTYGTSSYLLPTLSLPVLLRLVPFFSFSFPC